MDRIASLHLGFSEYGAYASWVAAHHPETVQLAPRRLWSRHPMGPLIGSLGIALQQARGAHSLHSYTRARHLHLHIRLRQASHHQRLAVSITRAYFYLKAPSCTGYSAMKQSQMNERVFRNKVYIYFLGNMYYCRAFWSTDQKS